MHRFSLYFPAHLQDLSEATTFSQELFKAIREAGFMPEGGILGFACWHVHAYPRSGIGLNSYCVAIVFESIAGDGHVDMLACLFLKKTLFVVA